MSGPMDIATTPQPHDLKTPTVVTPQNEPTEERRPIARSPSMDMKAEQSELKSAAEQSLNVILDLGRDGCIRWVSPSWKEVVGTLPEDVKDKPIVDLLLSSTDAFKDAVESMRSDDSKSRIIRFSMAMGPHSLLREEPEQKEQEESQTPMGEEVAGEKVTEEQVINLKGQGILVSDRLNGEESHSIWMLRPSTSPREITIDLPEILVESLGVGAEMLANHLTSLTESDDPATHPPPAQVMCRICERQITPWWFEKHSEGCTQEHRAESEVSMAHDRLTEHRHAIVSVLDALDADARQGRPPVSGESPPQMKKAEYKGFTIGPPKNLSPPATSLQASPSRSRSREPSYGSIGHARSKSFAVRRPISKIVTLLVDLCDTALDVSMPSIKPNAEAQDGSFRSQSPQAENRISQIMGWQTPNVANSDDEQGLSTLIKDTEGLVHAKVDAILRYREVLEYTERIRMEFNALIIECTEAAMKKAESIKAGNLSDSSSTSDTENEVEPISAAASQDDYSVGSVEPASSVGSAPRDTESPSMIHEFERRQSLATSSTRSSSPMECPTPRSHVFGNPLSRSGSLNKRASMLIDSDTADSDSNMTRSAFIGSRRTESPEILARSASTNERKRRSLRLPHMPSPHRQPSPSRLPLAPASPMRAPRPRLPLGSDQMLSLPSPITSPPLSCTDSTSPLVIPLRHRRQSSAASSVADPNRPPHSPRLNAMSQPAARPATTSIKDFEIIKPISKGAFGSVYLSKKKTTGDYFAIKVLRKADMVAKNQVTNVKAERAIMMWQGESDFVAKLYWTFSSKDYLFLVMEYLNGGDCASLVKVLGSLPEDWTKKYIAEVVQGIEHLHSRGIVHRDIKPDNLLIDQKGHLKLTDFGLSRMGLIGRQKRALKSPNDSTPDLLKHGPFARTTSLTSSRSTSFDMQGTQGPSPGATPIMTPDLAGSLGQPSYFSLNRESMLGREHSRRKSGYRSDSGNSDTFATMFRNFSLSDERPKERIEEESTSEAGDAVDPYGTRPTSSAQSYVQPDTPPQSSMLPPPMALFDPEDSSRRFVGTPDYLAPETINGAGQDETSDWWSLGCILFEFLYGYPPFHADTPEKVFENILARRIDWPNEEECPASAEAKDLMSKLMTIDPKERLGSNSGEKSASGGEQIRSHPWFNGVNWDALLEDEASFIPAPEHPEDTEYFDARGATLQSFNEEMEDQASSPALTPGIDLQDRPHDALSRVRSQVNSMKRGLMPLHIPPHVRDTRSRRLSEPVANDDFGNFSFKNLPVLEKANKDLLQKMRIEAAQKQAKHSNPSTAQSSATSATAPSLEGSPLLPMPLKRTLSTKRPDSPSAGQAPGASPHRLSQPTSPLVQFSTGQNHERRKTSSTSSSFSYQSGQSLQPGMAFVPPSLPSAQSLSMTTSAASSPVRSARHSLNMLVSSPERTPATSRPQSMFVPSTTRARSHTVGSQDSGETAPNRLMTHNKRQSQVFDISPSSSDNEDPRTKALLRVQRKRQSSRRLSRIALGDLPAFRPLDILVCEDHPVSRLVMEKLLEKLKCRTITVTNGHEAAAFAMSEVQFDIIFMEFKLPQMSGADIARMIRDTKGANTHTPIIAVTGYLHELPQPHHFDALMEKPATAEKITEMLQKWCNWKPPGPNTEIPKQQPSYPKEISPLQHVPSSLKRESRRSEDSPSSQSSGPFSHLPGLRKRSSREHSIGSSFFGDTDSTNTEDIPQLASRSTDEWPSQKGLGITKPIPILQTQTHEPVEIDQSSSSSLTPPPPLLHQNSAPPSIDVHTPRHRRSAEAIQAKRANLERKRHECAESGDDEDEELGNVQVRARSPRGKHYNAKRSSKLGIEMMRTNSRGSIDEANPSPITPVPGSGPDHLDLHPNPREERADLIAGAIYQLPPRRSSSQHLGDPLLKTPPNPSTDVMAAALEPPERFPPESKGDQFKIIDMDATPRPPQQQQPAPTTSSATVVEVANRGEGREAELGLPIQVPDKAPEKPTMPATETGEIKT